MFSVHAEPVEAFLGIFSRIKIASTPLYQRGEIFLAGQNPPLIKGGLRGIL
jgi:hypothetical protein